MPLLSKRACLIALATFGVLAGPVVAPAQAQVGTVGLPTREEIDPGRALTGA